MQKAKIVVAVRKRPLFQKEKVKGYTDVIGVSNGNRVIVSEMKQKVDLTKYIEESVFNFDYAFDQNSTNQEIYSHIMSPLVDSAFEGAKVSCFAYGQTGSGKTYTMNGVMSKNLPGLYTLGAYDIFDKLNQPQFSHLTAYLSFYEIYCTKLYDLLNKRTELILRQDAKSNINVVGLSEMQITNVQQFEEHLKLGTSQRVTSQNSANSESSRSHAILQITLKHGKKGIGKVYFIDLAGNERGADHANQKKQTQIDGQQINKSLLQLKQCIRGLDQGKNHVPFRGSKLTMCLKDSFIGFCRTVMIGNISPASNSSQNTLNTLRYADRVKQLKNTEQMSKQQLKNRQMMLPRGNNNAIKIKINDSDDQQDIAEKKRKALQDYGIKNQDKKTNQQPIAISRKMSMGVTGKPNPVVKGSSLAKNGQINGISSVSTKQIPVTKIPQKKNTVGFSRQGFTQREQSQLMDRQQQSQNDYQSQRFQRHEPMQIQRPQHGGSVDMRKNLSGLIQNHQRINQNQNIYTNQSQNFSNPQTQYNNNYGYQNQGGLNLNYKPGNLFTQQRPVTSMQNYQKAPQQHVNNFTNNQDYNMNGQRGVVNNQAIIFNNNNMQQQQQQQQQQHMQSNNNHYYSNNTGNQINNQMGHQMGNHQVNNQIGNQMNNQMNRQMMNPISYQNSQIPQYQNMHKEHSIIPSKSLSTLSWPQLTSLINSTNDQSQRALLRSQLNQHLFQQQNQLLNAHSSTLQNEIQKIKEEMEIIKIVQHDRSQITSKQYAKLMYDSIDQKIGQLEMLKQKLNNFMYKLDDNEEIQIKFDKKQSNHQDQQLLDDFQ